MSTTPPNTSRGQTSDPETCTPSPSTTTPSSHFSSTPNSVDATYQVVRIKPTNTGWLMPGPWDLIQIIGPVSKNDTAVFDEGAAAAAAKAEDDNFEIPCTAHLTWGDRSIYLNCLYYSSSAALFTDVRECADKADRVSSVGITMQDAIFSAEEEEDDEMVEGEDVRDDNGNRFLVLHVNRGLAASARLYCKKLSSSQIGLTNGCFERLGLEKRRRDARWGRRRRTKKSEDDCT